MKTTFSFCMLLLVGVGVVWANEKAFKLSLLSINDCFILLLTYIKQGYLGVSKHRVVSIHLFLQNISSLEG